MSDIHWNTSAEVYSIESPRISFYQITNQELVATARLQPGMKVVDLACGAGLTSQTIVDLLGEETVIYAVDIAFEMLKQAKHSIRSKVVHFIHASADDFSQHILETVDRVLCNSAFWHFPDSDAVLREVHTVIKPTTGCFLFNIPDQEFDFGDGKSSEMAQVVTTLMRRSAVHDIGTHPEFSLDRISTLARANGFRVADFRILSIPLCREDLVRFYSIPHVSARWFPESPADQRAIAVRETFNALDPDRVILYRWAQFMLARTIP